MAVSVVCAFSPFHARKKPPLAFTSGRYDAKIQFFSESRHFRPLFKPSPTPTRLKRTRTTTLPMEEVSSHGDELDTSTRSGYILRFHRKFRPFRHRSRSSGCTRPDIAAATGILARHGATPGKKHVDAVKRLIQYVYNTRTLGIKYSRESEGDKNTPIIYGQGRHPLDDGKNHMMVFADSDYAADTRDAALKDAS